MTGLLRRTAFSSALDQTVGSSDRYARDAKKVEHQRLEHALEHDDGIVSVSAAEISRNFGVWQDRASQCPVVVTHHGRPRVVLMAIDAYEKASAPMTSIPGDTEATLRLSALAEHCGCGFLALDEALRITLINSQAAMHLGLPPNKLIGKTVPELRPDVAQSPQAAVFRKVLDDGEPITMDVPTYDDPRHLWRIHVFPYPGGVAATFQSVVHEMQIDVDAREREAIFAAALAHGNVAAGRLSLRGTFLRQDPNLARAAAVPTDKIVGARLTDLLALKYRAAASDEIEAVFGRGETRRFRSRLHVNGGNERDVSIAIAPIQEPIGITGALMLMTMRGEALGGADDDKRP